MRRFIPIALALAALACASLVSAQVVTDPVGFTTLTVNAKPASIRGFTLLSLDLARLPVFQALVPASGVSTNGSNQTVLTFPASTFTSGAFNGTHYLEITNGTNAGRISDIVSNTDSQITLADNLGSSVTAGSSTIKITPMWTLGTVFGITNSAGLQGGAVASQADVVQIFNPATGASTLYFYSTTNNRWQTGGTDATNAVIQPDAGLRIERKTATAVSFNLTGAVKLGPTGIFVQGGNNAGNPTNINYISNPYPTASTTLATSNLYTGSSATGVLGGAVASQADTLSLYDSASGLSTIYFYNTTNSRWQTGGTDASNVTIPDGTAVTIKRKPANGSFIWYAPQPFTYP
jgi:uncharacterized protein (TIGR02597 family)